MSDARKLKSFSVVRYEDLVRDPAAALRPVTDRIGLSPLTDPPAGVRDDLNEKYFSEWWRLRKEDPFERVLGTIVRAAASPVFRRFGYRFEVGSTGSDV